MRVIENNSKVLKITPEELKQALKNFPPIAEHIPDDSSLWVVAGGGDLDIFIEEPKVRTR